MAAGVPSGSVVPAHARDFGKYELIVKLATGGMAEIFLARAKTGVPAEFVVIKRILPHLDEDEQFVAMFLDEARIAARITHPNVCQVYELGEVEGQYFLALESLEGITLNAAMRKLAQKKLTPDARFVCAVLAQAAEGLHHAHELSDLDGPLHIVHRDVSPQNLFVTVQGMAKVLDFGIAKAHGASSRTRTGTVKGKYAYMPPEQLRGDPLDRRTDVWALGVVLFEALTGKRLFWRDTDFLIFRAITDEAIPRLRDYRPDAPPALDEAVARAISRPREERFASAAELAAAVRAAVAPLGGPMTGDEIGAEVERLFVEELAAHRTTVREALKALSAPARASTAAGGASGRMRAVAPGVLPREDFDTLDESQKPIATAPGRATLPLPPPDEPSRPAAPAQAVAALANAGRITEPITRAPAVEAPPPEPPIAAVATAGPAGAAATQARRTPISLSADAASLRPRRRGGWLWLVLGAAAIAAVAWALTRGPSGTEPRDVSALPAGAGGAGSGVGPAAMSPDAASAAAPVPPPRAPLPVAGPADAGVAAIVPPKGAAPDAAPLVAEVPRDRPRDRPRPPKDPPPRDPPPPRDGPPPRDPPKDPAPAGPPGWISIDSDPYATIYVDGKKVGVTPLAKIPLPPGPHKVRAVSAKGEQTFNVTIESGKEARGKKLSW